MSDFLQNPNFQPNEEFKNLIDSLFQEEKKVKKKKKEVHEHTYELNLPEAPPLAKEEEELAIKIVRDELEQFRVVFLEMQDKVSDMGIYTYLYPGLEVLGEECSEFRDLIEDDFDKEALSEIGEEDYEEAKKVRARILASIFNKYKQGK
jgi:hypothetical protein